MANHTSSYISTHHITGPLTLGIVTEGFRRIWDLRTKLCLGREENEGIEGRKTSFTCPNINKNVNIAQLFSKGWVFIQSYI